MCHTTSTSSTLVSCVCHIMCTQTHWTHGWYVMSVILLLLWMYVQLDLLNLKQFSVLFIILIFLDLCNILLVPYEYCFFLCSAVAPASHRRWYHWMEWRSSCPSTTTTSSGRMISSARPSWACRRRGGWRRTSRSTTARPSCWRWGDLRNRRDLLRYVDICLSDGCQMRQGKKNLAQTASQLMYV